MFGFAPGLSQQAALQGHINVFNLFFRPRSLPGFGERDGKDTRIILSAKRYSMGAIK
jgi:hypothetical protein